MGRRSNSGGLLFSDFANLADIARVFRVSECSVELVPTLPSVRNVYGAKLHEHFFKQIPG